ncbi:MAG TPA: phosphatase PAP2 family protein [Roseiarcus sp.]|jgi:acid phosphatase (class A)|nr:phosphatase PAP2 family protein [Roseiarcus sp.]
MLRIAILVAALVLALPPIAFADEEGAHGTLHYLRPGEVDLAKILPPPPKPDSPAQRRDLAVSLAWQERRTPAMVALAQADQDRSIFRFGVIFGDRFTKERLPKAAALFGKALDDERIVGAEAKTFWSRARPFAASKRIRPCVVEPPTDSYPSNHATTGALYAEILARMLPEQKGRIRARADQYGRNRVICGVHYQTDVEAGERAGALEARAMFQNADFRRDFAAARIEIRKTLLARPGS